MTQAKFDGNVPDRNSKSEINTLLNIVKSMNDLNSKITITEKKELPLRYVALTQCFRAEAGAAGRDTRGMIRQHQFQKVEMVSITEPELSAQEHERMLACAEIILKVHIAIKSLLESLNICYLPFLLNTI